jgi:hypothetical protein
MVNQVKTRFVQFALGIFTMKIVSFSLTDIHKKWSTTTCVYYNGRRSGIHVFPWQETPLENGIFSLFGTRFHLEEPIFS